MLFQNLCVYRLMKGWSITTELLTEQLSHRPFTACGDADATSCGWVSPRPNGPLVHSVNGQLLIAMKSELKKVPASAVKTEANARAARILEQEGRQVGRKEMRDIKEAAALALIPRAFPAPKTTLAWIDPENGWLVIDASTGSRAEELLELLRRSVSPLPSISLWKTVMSPSAAMTLWVSGSEAPPDFTVDQDLELCSAEKAIVKYVSHNLDSEDVRKHIVEGKVATKLGLTWRDRISFVFTDTLLFKHLSFLDILKEENQNDADNEEERFDLDFTLMSGELARLLAAVHGALGGDLPLDGSQDAAASQP